MLSKVDQDGWFIGEGLILKIAYMCYQNPLNGKKYKQIRKPLVN